tara:strand:- start:325 stop:678 length:354 start_codon:yes stop_codon:yes gene_type:complete
MKALILNNNVVQVVEKEFEVHESLTWVDCNDQVQPGWTYDGKTFTSDAATADQIAAGKLQELRQQRNRLLKDTDHWAYQDTATMTKAQTDYRQALRDITKTYSSVNDEGFTWPTKPE